MYNFDEIIDRRNTDCLKLDACEQRFGMPGLLPLWVADMDFRTPDFIIQALRKRLEHEILGYTVRPDSFLLSAQAWLKRRYGWDVRTEDMLFSPGVVPAINFAVQEFTQPGDKVMVNTPVYHPFFFAIKDQGRTLVCNSLQERNGHHTIDFDDMERQMANGVKMLIFCNPHNPVGRVWTRQELLQVGQLCIKYNVLILSDDIHSDLVFAPHRHVHIASLSEQIAQQTITLMAPSKTFNLAGLSTAFAHSANPTLLKQFGRPIAQTHLSMGNLFGAVALEAAYTHGDEWLNQLLAYLDGNCTLVVDYIKQHIPGIVTYKPEGTYLMWLDCRGLGLKQPALEQLMTHKAALALNTGTMFGPEGQGFMRLNVASPRSVIEQALKQLREAVSK